MSTRPTRVEYVSASTLQEMQEKVNALLRTNDVRNLQNWRLAAPVQFLDSQWIQAVILTSE